MARMSNRDRIARAAEEARLTEEEKVAKKATKKTTKKATKRTAKAKDVRMKLVWVVFNSHGKPVKTYPYPDKDAATSEAQKLTNSTGFTHAVRTTRVPME